MIEKEEFNIIAYKAVNGEEKSIIKVIELFMSKIIASSFYNGSFNEDIKVEIIAELYKSIPKFNPEKYKK